VDNPEAVSSALSVRDKEAQRVASEAKQKLRASEGQRNGTRIHPNYFTPSGKPLASGENFASSLRSIATQECLIKETEAMLPRREREQYLKQYFEGRLADGDGIEREGRRGKGKGYQRDRYHSIYMSTFYCL
jgi:hypothetical protein